MATSYGAPGVYIEEVDRGTKPIEGVGTSVAAFVGFTERAGPETNPQALFRKAELVTNWNQFTQKFGRFIPGAFLPQAVYGYFANGGGRCYVISIGTQDPALASPAQAALPSAADPKSDSLLLRAREGGPAGNDLSVVVEHEGNGVAPEGDIPTPDEVSAKDKPAAREEDSAFKIIINQGWQEAERFEGLTMGSGKNSVETMIKSQSKLIEIEILGKVGKLAERRPAEGRYPLQGGQFQLLAVTPPQFEGDAPRREGLGALEALDDVTIVACPDLMSSYLRGDFDLEGVQVVQQAMLTHCQRMKYRFAILDAPPDISPQEVGDWRRKVARYDSKYGALYYPWIKIANPLEGDNGSTMLAPSCGHLAGIYARSDQERGVHKAPANEVVLGAVDLAINVTREEQDDLNRNGVNCIRAFPGQGIRVWGARTLSQSNPAWRFINVRRLFNYVEASIEAGTRWIVFEPNDQDLWARVRRDVSAFLRRVWRSGALFGATAEEAFYVKVDAELNPPEVRDAGQLIIEIGLAPVKPAEFVIFRISQWAGPNAEA